MSRVSFFDAVLQKGTDGRTSVVAGATVKVYSSGTVNLATLYENDGITPQVNPVVTDFNGNYRFRIDEGAYDVRIEYSGFDETTNNLIFGSSPQSNLTLGTGRLSGGVPSVNIDGLTVDITSGTGKVVDNYSAEPNVTIADVSWNAFSSIVPAFKATSLTSIIGIDKDGLIVQQDTFPKGQAMRDVVWIGSAVHADGVNVTEFNMFGVAPITQVSKGFDDLAFAMGVINISGNRCIGSSGNALKLFKGSGEVHFAGIDALANPANPNFKLVPALDEPEFIYTWHDGLGGWNTSTTSDIDNGVYDDGTVSTTSPNGSVSNNQWTILRIQYTPDQNIVLVHYGQVLYSSSSVALEALSNGTDIFEVNPALTAVPFINFLIIKGNATNLNDPSESVFISADKFGGAGGQSSSSPSTVTLQSAYDDNTQGCHIKTNDLHAAVCFERGTSGGDSDDVLEVENGASVKTFSVTGEGQVNTEQHVQFAEVTAPSTPATGKVAVYAKSDGLMYSKDDAGLETALGGGGGGGLGIGQTWQTVTRSSGVTYTNSTGSPIEVQAVIGIAGVNNTYNVTVGGLVIVNNSGYGANSNYGYPVAFVVPDGVTYKITIVVGTLDSWKELR